MYGLKKKKKKARSLISSLIGLTCQRFVALAAVVSVCLLVIYPSGLNAEHQELSLSNYEQDDEEDEEDDEDDDEMLREDYLMPYKSGMNRSHALEHANSRQEKLDRGAMKLALDMDDRREILKEHNRQRRNLTPPAANMVQMVWSLELEKSATEITRGCREVENIPFGRKRYLFRFFSFTGINVFQQKTRKLPVTVGVRAVRTWMQEAAHYNFDWNSCKLGKTCNRFLKVIWGDASHVGCSLKVCAKFRRLSSDQIAEDRQFVVCIYGGGHDMVMRNNQPYLSGDSCSHCPSGFSSCVMGLCQTEPVCETVVDCVHVADKENCLCEESVYKSGQQKVARRFTSLDLSSMAETVVLLLLCKYLQQS